MDLNISLTELGAYHSGDCIGGMKKYFIRTVKKIINIRIADKKKQQTKSKRKLLI